MIDLVAEKLGRELPWETEDVMRVLKEEGIRYMSSVDLYSLVINTNGNLNTAVRDAKILIVSGNRKIL